MTFLDNATGVFETTQEVNIFQLPGTACCAKQCSNEQKLDNPGTLEGVLSSSRQQQ